MCVACEFKLSLYVQKLHAIALNDYQGAVRQPVIGGRAPSMQLRSAEAGGKETLMFERSEFLRFPPASSTARKSAKQTCIAGKEPITGCRTA